MEAYEYKVGADSFQLLIERFEAHMLSRLRPFPSHDAGVLAVHKSGIVRTIDRLLLVEKTQRLWDVLHAQEHLIQYTYSVVEKDRDGRRHAFGGGRACQFRGESAVLESGPGFCHIKTGRSVPLTHDQIASIAVDAGIDASALPGNIPYLDTRVLHDLRDMKPVVLDGGEVVRAGRRRRPTQIVRKLTDLLSFLEGSAGSHVELSVIESFRTG